MTMKKLYEKDCGASWLVVLCDKIDVMLSIYASS